MQARHDMVTQYDGAVVARLFVLRLDALVQKAKNEAGAQAAKDRRLLEGTVLGDVSGQFSME